MSAQKPYRGTSRSVRRLATLAVVVAAVAAGYQFWNRRLRDQFHPRRFARVEAGLFRSGQIAPRLVEDVLKTHSIDTVVALLHYDRAKESHRAELEAARALGVEIRWLHLQGDGTGESDSYVEALSMLAAARSDDESVLVHCSAGVQRTGAVLALYKLLVERSSPEAAYAELARFGVASVNPALPAFLNTRIPAIESELIRRGVVDQPPGAPPRLPTG